MAIRPLMDSFWHLCYKHSVFIQKGLPLGLLTKVQLEHAVGLSWTETFFGACLEGKVTCFLGTKVDFSGNDAVYAYALFDIFKGINDHHSNYSPTKDCSLGIRIIIISWDDLSWLDGTRTINTNEEAYF